MASSLQQYSDINGDEYLSITIPANACSFPCSIHPHALHLMQLSDSWLLDRCKPITALLPQSKLAAKLFSAQHLLSSAFGLLTVLFFANAVSTQRVFPVLKLMNWYFMLDNWVDEPGMWGAHPATSKRIIDAVISVFVPSSNRINVDGKLLPGSSSLSIAVHTEEALGTLTFGKESPSPLSLPELDIGRDQETNRHSLQEGEVLQPSCDNSDFPLASTLSQKAHHPTTLMEHVMKPAAVPLPAENTTCNNGSAFSEAHGITQELARILTTTAAEWWSDLCVDMPLSQQVRFCKIFRGYLSSIPTETPFRSSCTLPDLHAYLGIRCHTIGWYPLALLTEYSLCMELDEAAITNPLLITLMESVCEAIVIGNDIVSFCKEYERGDHFNIIMVLCYQKLKIKGCSRVDGGADAGVAAHAALPTTWAMELVTPELLQESMNEACEMAKQKDRECACRIEEMKGSTELMEKPGMGAFVEAMGNYLAGNVYWGVFSGRYDIFAIGEKYCHFAPEQLERGMTIALAPRILNLKRPAQVIHGTPF